MNLDEIKDHFVIYNNYYEFHSLQLTYRDYQTLEMYLINGTLGIL